MTRSVNRLSYLGKSKNYCCGVKSREWAKSKHLCTKAIRNKLKRELIKESEE